MSIDGLAQDIAPYAVVAHKEVLIASFRIKRLKLFTSHIKLSPSTAHVRGVAPQHLRDDGGVVVVDVHPELVHHAGVEAPDVPVPQVIDDLSEVDVQRQSPGNVLPYPRRGKKPAKPKTVRYNSLVEDDL